ncbi:serine hydrolase domain-containing protein [Paenarthrobacter sp. NPDC056912]|uniref:serine hydrolase domain-containing protein n=1 Tax=Paenarthrobacter sp. NPDC056912 TaxID=3345965 RepID=UPI00366C47B1
MHRPRTALTAAALACGLCLSGCTGEAEPEPTVIVPPSVVFPTTVPPLAPTPSESAATPAFQELKAALELFSREKLEEGASAVLIQARIGSQEWSHAAFSRDAGASVPEDARFRIGALARTMVAVSVMRLVQEGRLSLDDSITAHLPGVDGIPAGIPPTIRQLLGAHSGLPDAASLPSQSVLGLLVERLRGAPLGEVLRSEILEPLGLASTGMLGGSLRDGMYSTVEDINAFHAALLKGQLLAPESLIDMKGPVSASYGLGLDHWDDRCTNGYYYGHSGDVPGYGSIAVSSADAHRQLAIFVSYATASTSAQPSAVALELTGVAQVALNSGCRFQFR